MDGCIEINRDATANLCLLHLQGKAMKTILTKITLSVWEAWDTQSHCCNQEQNSTYNP